MSRFRTENTIEGTLVLRFHAFEHKAYHFFLAHRAVGKLVMPLLSILNHLLLQWIFNCVIPKEVKIGRNCSMPHPFGIVMTPKCTIGSNVKIMQNVTIGANELSSQPYEGVHIGDGSYIGANAVIVGNDLRVGENVVIGAGAVVTKNIPSSQTVVGNPARPLPNSVVEASL